MLKAELDSNKSLKPSFSILVIIFSRLLDFEIIEHIYKANSTRGKHQSLPDERVNFRTHRALFSILSILSVVKQIVLFFLDGMNQFPAMRIHRNLVMKNSRPL